MAANHKNVLTRLFFKTAYRRRLHKYLGDVRGMEILEIGAGYGHLVRAAKAAGAIVDAFEPRAECLDSLSASGVRSMFPSPLCPPLLNNKKYDWCVCLTVLDEVADKLGFMKSVKECLSPGGKVLIEVRNTNYGGRFRSHLETDCDPANYCEIFSQSGFKICKVDGEPRPLTFGGIIVFAKTLAANFFSLISAKEKRQMRVFLLKEGG